MKYYLILLLIFLSISAFAQTGIGTTTPNASAKLDVYATNKGFLPPRVTLSSTTDVTTIASPAEGLLVYNLGSVGLQAGYYYWNGANWATIATATSAGNGVTASDLVKLYSQAYSTAANTVYSGYSFTVPVSGRYLFDFTSSGYNTGYITFKVKQGVNVIAVDSQYSVNNGVHVEYNGKIEANLQSGVTYNAYVNTSGSRDAGDYDRVYYKLIAGNLPVTGQTVDYVSTSLSSQYASVGSGYDIVLQQLNGGNIPYNTSTGVYTLSANKTYMMQAQLRVNTASASSAYLQYAWVDATSNNVLIANSDALTSSQSSSAGYGSKEVTQIIYTPSTNQTIKLRSIGNLGTQTITQGTAVIMQIGSSAIINPWVLSGNDVYNTTGKVGIGNNAPTKVLDVTGDAKISGILTSGGNAYPTTSGTDGQALTSNGAGALSWNSVPPVGVVSAFAGSSAPSGYLLCNGSAVSRTTYASLFAIIGTTYGTGDGSTTFNLPDLRSKTIVGVGQGTGLTNRALASTSGSETKTLTTTELPSHNHGVTDPGHFHFVSGGTTDDRNFSGSGSTSQMYGVFADAGGYNDGDNSYGRNTNTKTTGISINNTGSGSAFNIMNPFLALNYIIKY